jgi:hypothetical protein
MKTKICPCDCSGEWTRNSIYDARASLFTTCNSRSSMLVFLQAILRSVYWYEKFYAFSYEFSSDTDLFTYSVAGRVVCPVAFQHFWNITDYTRRKIEKSIKRGENLDIPHGNCFVDRPDPKRTLCMGWLEEFTAVCEHQPDSDEIHTVARCTKIELWEEMCHDLLKDKKVYQREDLPSFPVFVWVWNKHFPHLKIPKVCRLGRCDVCVKLEEDLKTARGQAKQDLLAKKTRHKLQNEKERTKMRELQRRAINNPEMWTSISTDW